MESWKSRLFRAREYSQVNSSDYDEVGKLLKTSVDDDLSYTMSPLYDVQRGSQQQRSRVSKAIIAFNAMFLLLSLWLFTMAMTVGLTDVSHRERNYFLKMTSEPSPLLDLIDIPLTMRRMNGTFMIVEPASIFRAPPSPEVDAAWARIETQAPVPITRADVVAQGQNPARAAKFPESFGFGPDAYIGRVDVFHQIHCLNRLRMHLKGNYDYYYANTDTNNDYHDLHVSHCVYTLLQNLMCSANVDVYTHTWLDAQKAAFPDFSMNHKCRDFDAVLRWHHENAVPLEKFGAIRGPVDFEPHFMNHDFKTIFQWYDEHPDDGDFGHKIA